MTRTSRVWLLIVCASLSALLAAGCGSSGRHTTQATTNGQVAGGQATTAPTATGPQSGSSSSAKGNGAAGGSGAGAAGSGAAGSGAAGSGAGASGAPGAGTGGSAANSISPRRFTYLANTLCANVGGGGLHRAVPSSSTQLRQYARTAFPPAQRILIVLQRLSAQANGAGAGQLVSDYRALVALYAQTAHGGISAGASTIRAAQQKATAAARALHVPLCAPVSVSVSPS